MGNAKPRYEIPTLKTTDHLYEIISKKVFIRRQCRNLNLIKILKQFLNILQINILIIISKIY
jgi:hypothetical protein